MHLETDGLTKRFGGIVALDDVSLDFVPGTITALIGPNGAGKTTLFNVIAGFLKPDAGSVFLVSTDPGQSDRRTNITGIAPDEVANHGIGVVFQNIRVFKRLSALQNVAVGSKNQLGEICMNAILRTDRVWKEEEEVLARASSLLAYIGLADKGAMLADQLSYGQQKLIAIARLLAGDSAVLLFDEPTSGVDPDMTSRLLSLIKTLADHGKTVIMIEHNLDVVQRVGDWVYLMADGCVEVFGKPEEVLRDRTLREFFPRSS